MEDNVKTTRNLKLEKMRYQNNNTSYTYGMCAILISIFAMFIGLNSIQAQNNPSVMLVIILNIAILLFGFMACEKVKTYSIKYSYVMFGIAGVCVLRIFWLPLQLIIYGAKWASSGSNRTPEVEKLCKKYLGTVITNGTGFLPANGVFRGILAIVLLLLAAFLFVMSGLVCYQKSVKLNKYLASQEQK